MTLNLQSTTTLNNGVEMPWFGLGVFKTEPGPEVERAVTAALEVGYRSIDTAKLYGNEVGVGKAVRASGIPREDIFVTTKVWNSDQGYESTLKAFEASAERLDIDYIDLYLIHWPGNRLYVETWKALEKLYNDGRVRAIGVSNFSIHHLQDIFDNSDIVPVLNQVELHPRLRQKELHDFCREHHIQLEAWSPLMRGQILDHPDLVAIGEKYGKSAAQVILRWNLQHEIVTIPKSVNPGRIEENAQVFDFELSAEDMAQIDAMDQHERIGPDPDTFTF